MTGAVTSNTQRSVEDGGHSVSEDGLPRPQAHGRNVSRASAWVSEVFSRS